MSCLRTRFWYQFPWRDRHLVDRHQNSTPLESVSFFSVRAQSLSGVWHCDPMDCNPPGSSVRGIFQVRMLEWAAIFSSRDLPNPGIEPASPASTALVGRFFTTEPPGKADNSTCYHLRLLGVCSSNSEFANKQKGEFRRKIETSSSSRKINAFSCF